MVIFMPFNVLILHQEELDVAKWLWKSYFRHKGSLDRGKVSSKFCVSFFIAALFVFFLHVTEAKTCECTKLLGWWWDDL